MARLIKWFHFNVLLLAILIVFVHESMLTLKITMHVLTSRLGINAWGQFMSIYPFLPILAPFNLSCTCIKRKQSRYNAKVITIAIGHYYI